MILQRISELNFQSSEFDEANYPEEAACCDLTASRSRRDIQGTDAADLPIRDHKKQLRRVAFGLPACKDLA